jgi:hypothetical protein
MSSESVCRLVRSWVAVGSSHTCLVMRLMIFTSSVRNILDKSSYGCNETKLVLYFLQFIPSLYIYRPADSQLKPPSCTVCCIFTVTS